MMRGRFGLIAAVAVLAVLLLVGRAFSAVAVDHAWYAALDAGGVWREKMLALLLLKGGAWLLGSAFAFANLWAVRRTIRAIAVPARVGDLEIAEEIPARRFLPVTLGTAALVGAVLTILLDDWTLLSMARHGVAFAEYEFYFHRDLGFYVYWLPFEAALYTWALLTVVVATALVTLLYTITRDLRLVGRQLVASTHVRRHLTTLGALVLGLLAWSYRLDAYELLLWGSGFDGLFTHVDHAYTTRIDLALAIGTFAAALIVLRAGWMGQVRAAFVTVTLVLVGALVLRQAAPAIVANGTMAGDIATRDRDYEATRALFTRRAYDVESMRFGEPTSDTSGTPTASAFEGVALWDADVLSRIRGGSDALLTPVLPPVWMAGPEGPQAVVVMRSTAVTPVWDVRVIPGTLADARGTPLLLRHRGLGAASLPEPLVAPGFTDHRVVPGALLASSDERPRVPARGDPFADRTIPAAALSHMGARLVHAWTTRDITLLTTASAAEPDAVVMHRDVRGRVHRLAPMLVQGDAITPIVHGGALLWAVELYSASEHYPLSLRFHLVGAPRSYFRHAATALVDAHTGRVRFVTPASVDPIARTWFARLPVLMLTEQEIPASLRASLPVLNDAAAARLRAFTRVGSRRTGHAPSYVPDSLPGMMPVPVATAGPSGSVVGWSVPLVNEADQLVGIFETTGGSERATRWHPMAEPLPRWSALAGQLTMALDSAAAHARDETDGPVDRGVIRVRAHAGRPVLVRPAYTDDAGSVRLVAVAAVTDTAVVAGPSLEALLGDPAGDPSGFDRTDAGRQAEARRLYDAMRAALRQSDWPRFGATFDSLGRVLGRVP